MKASKHNDSQKAHAHIQRQKKAQQKTQKQTQPLPVLETEKKSEQNQAHNLLDNTTNALGVNSHNPHGSPIVPKAHAVYDDLKTLFYNDLQESYAKTNHVSHPDTRKKEDDYLSVLHADEALKYLDLQNGNYIPTLEEDINTWQNDDTHFKTAKATLKEDFQTTKGNNPEIAPPKQTIRLHLGIVPATINSNAAFFDFMNLSIFGKTTHINWNLEGNTYKDYIGTNLTCKVAVSTLKTHLGFTDAQWEDLQNRTTTNTTDAATFRTSATNYLKKAKHRIDNLVERDILETKLYGLEAFYKDHQNYILRLKTSSNIGSAIAVVNDWEKLDQKAKQHGFKGLTDFENTIKAYELAFRTETQNLLNDYLDYYAHNLYKEEQKLNEDKHLDVLWQQLQGNTIQTHSKALEGLQNDPNRYSSKVVNALDGTETITDHNKAAIASKQEALKASMQPLNTTLVKDTDASTKNDIDYEKLAKAANKAEMKAMLLAFIKTKQNALTATRKDIEDHPENVYQSPELLALSYQQQDVKKGSFQYTIIQNHIKDLRFVKILTSISLALVAVVVTLGTWGMATPFVAAGAALSLGISAYGIFEAVEDYNRKDAAHEISLLKDEPNYLWVVLAIAGAALDLAALKAIFKTAQIVDITAAAKAFNESGDLLQLQKALGEITELNTKVKANLIKQAQLSAEYRQVMQSLKKPVYFNFTAGLDQLAARALVAAYYSFRRGITKFDNFLLELKAQKIINDINSLSPEQLSVLKQAFIKGTAKDSKALKKSIKALQKEIKIENEAINIANKLKQTGKFKTSSDYHAFSTHNISESTVIDIITDAEAVFLSKNGKYYYYLKDETIVLVNATGSGKGIPFTAYGKAGVKGESGAKVLGGLPTDPGVPVTFDMIINGKIPFFDKGKLSYYGAAKLIATK